MSFTDTERELQELQQMQSSYMPNDSVAAELGKKTLIMLVGPACVGKTFIMEQVIGQDERFAITGTFTTREKRPDDNKKNYTYIPHDDKGIARIYDTIKRGEAVQYAVHPTSGRIYGSDMSDYPKDFCMLDTLSSAVDAIRRLPAKETIVLGVVTEPEQWLAWFTARFPKGHPERIKRRDEAVQSLNWLLEQPMNSLHWIVNAKDQADAAAARVIAVSEGLKGYDMHGPLLAQAMIDAAGELQA